VRAGALVAGPAAVRAEAIASVAGICHAVVVETGTPSEGVREDSMDPVHVATAAAAPPASDLEVEVEEALVAAAEVPAVAEVPVVAAGADRSPIHEKRIKGNEIGIARYNLVWSCMYSVCARVRVVVRLLPGSGGTPRTKHGWPKHGWPKGDCLICGPQAL
jgi:hypothetical protein